MHLLSSVLTVSYRAGVGKGRFCRSQAVQEVFPRSGFELPALSAWVLGSMILSCDWVAVYHMLMIREATGLPLCIFPALFFSIL